MASITLARTLTVIPVMISIVFCLPVSDISIEDRALIINGTSSSVGYKAEAFVYCRVDTHDKANIHKYEIHWLDQNNVKVTNWSEDKHVFIVGNGLHIPESYLVFHNFNSPDAGVYTCQLRKEGVLIASSTITITQTD
ncbi:unnamed protein product [Meganyctiphanes norvegica]|uniref:Ig-like domain-containing protein n=1 Tax=Meganyctiphanes norvegica TaxID=48144 RepID=A0AAV2R963_MEGNR